MALTDLTTPATVATELGTTAGDARLQRVITAASEAIRRFLGRPALHYQVGYIEKVQGFGSPRLLLGLCPVLSVASVTTEDGAAITDFILEDSEAGFLYRASGSWPWTGVVRPGLLYSDPAMGTEKRSITVTYTGGWVTQAQADSGGWVGPARSLPADIEEACIQTLTSIYRGSGQDRSVLQESIGDYSVTYADRFAAGTIPESAKQLLGPYRRMFP